MFPEQAAEREWVEELRAVGAAVHFESGSRRRLTDWLGEHLDADREPTVLHTHFTVYDIPAALAARRRPDVHAFWHIHTVLSEGLRAVLANSLKFALFGRYVERIFSPSSDVAAAVRRRLAPAEKVSVFPNTVDPDAFPSLAPERRAEFRDQLGLQRGGQVLLHFGRDWYLKDGDIFLDALAILLRENRPLTGLVNQGGEAASEAAARRGIEAHVRSVGQLPQANPFYGAADVLVASSRGETMPFTVMESLCSGTPVVASDLPGHRYLGDQLEACTIVPRDAGRHCGGGCGVPRHGGRERARICARRAIGSSSTSTCMRAAARLVDDYERAALR